MFEEQHAAAQAGWLAQVRGTGTGGIYPRPVQPYQADRLIQQYKALQESEVDRYRQRHNRRHQNKKAR